MKYIRSLATCFAVALGLEAQALVVHFGDVTRGPSDILLIDGVTVCAGAFWSGPDPQYGQPATVLGVGLGDALIAPSYTIDRQLSFEGGSLNHTTIDEELRISVTGTINSLTLVPYFSVLNQDEQVMFPFDVHFQPKSGFPPLWMTVDPSNPSPFKYTFSPDGEMPSYLYFIGCGSDSYPGTDAYIYDYLIAKGYPAMTFQMGFTITELDYTPIPEPSTFALLSISATSLLIFRRRK